ncbi:MAG TPA: LLM class flavin-dependent oxidoreductase [Terriglobia bacterium]|nr:LLM class flavin-dependent oxidoreductase [Terriglobia bacterium]
MKDTAAGPLDLFTTCPPYNGTDYAEYVRKVCDVSRWSDEVGCKGMLVYTDNGLLDPWLVSQIVIQNTTSLAPLVAVQPVYMHPYSVAKMVSTLSYLHGRRLCLNMVAGGFKNDLIALNDTTPHDRRYDRLVEYTTIIQRLLAAETPVTFEGDFYRVERLTLKPPLPRDLYPIITISGSSEAGLAAAQKLGVIPVAYPEPPDRCKPLASMEAGGSGIRVGIIARDREDEAWGIAHRRFPPDRKGQLTHDLAMKVSDSVWHRTLSDLGAAIKEQQSVYWLWPFENYKGFCPYLVGSYEQVVNEVVRYASAGNRTFILDVPASRDELDHVGVVFAQARERLAA